MPKYSLVAVDFDPFAEQKKDLPKGELGLKQGPMSYGDWWPFVKEALKQYGGQVMQGIADAAMLPGNVLQGNVDPNSDEGFGQVMGLTGLLPMAGLGFAEPGAAGIFGGRLAQGTDKRKLLEAIKMEAQRKPRQEIYDQTGWWRGHEGGKAGEGLWRTEIPDDEAKMTGRLGFGPVQPPNDLTLADVLEHPKLYEAYPQLKDMGVELIPDREFQQGNLGWFNPTRDKPFGIARGVAGDPSVLLHEIQHAVQHMEKFAPGGNELVARHARTDIDPEGYSLRLDDALRYNTQPIMRGFLTGTTEPEDLNTIKMLGHLSNQDLTRFRDHYNSLIPQSTYDIYRNLAGEVEARNVQARYEGAKGAPWKTEDVPQDSQIVKMRKRVGVFDDYSLLGEKRRAQLQNEIDEKLAEQVELFTGPVSSTQMIERMPQVLMHGSIDAGRFAHAPSSEELDKILKLGQEFNLTELRKFFPAQHSFTAENMLKKGKFDELEAFATDKLKKGYTQEDFNNFLYGTNAAPIFNEESIKLLRDSISNIEGAIYSAQQHPGGVADIAREFAWLAPKLPTTGNPSESEKIALLALHRGLDMIETTPNLDLSEILRQATEYTGKRVSGDKDDTRVLLEPLAKHIAQREATRIPPAMLKAIEDPDEYNLAHELLAMMQQYPAYSGDPHRALKGLQGFLLDDELEVAIRAADKLKELIKARSQK